MLTYNTLVVLGFGSVAGPGRVIARGTVKGARLKIYLRIYLGQWNMSELGHLYKKKNFTEGTEGSGLGVKPRG